MADITITCKDCGKEFVFTEGEQAFFKQVGLEHNPVRCPECRKARKASKQTVEQKNEQTEQSENAN